tara:strand:+ start:229 stop:405 length:177 start_codon:yes stop_codon:yes gene_type:complete
METNTKLKQKEKYIMVTNKTMNELNAYKKAFDVVMDNFDELSEESKAEIDCVLKELGL